MHILKTALLLNFSGFRPRFCSNHAFIWNLTVLYSIEYKHGMEQTHRVEDPPNFDKHDKHTVYWINTHFCFMFYTVFFLMLYCRIILVVRLYIIKVALAFYIQIQGKVFIFSKALREFKVDRETIICHSKKNSYKMDYYYTLQLTMTYFLLFLSIIL